MKNPFKVFSFRYTFFFTFLLFALTLILLIGVTSYSITTQETVARMIESRKLLLSEIHKQLITQMQVIEHDSLTLSSNPKIINYLNNAGEPYERVQQKRDILDQISRLSYVKEGVHSVELYSKNIESDETFGTNGLYNYAKYEANDLYEPTRHADSGWIGAHEAVSGLESEDNEVISFVRKITTVTGNEVGVLVINMKLDYVKKIVANQSPHDSRYILDSYDRLITEVVGDGMKPFAVSNADNRVIRAMDKANPEKFAIFESDQKMLLIWDKQMNSNWVVLDAIPWDYITQASSKIKSVILIAIVACTALAVVMALLLSRQFSLPIRHLVRAVSQVKSGNLNIQIQNEYENEFGTLNDSIHLMIQRIQSLLAEVDEQNRKKREAELQMLQEQINPHFLYNTLDMINWRAIEYGAGDISKMLSLLGKMLRLGLSKGAAFIPIRDEMEYLRYYIELQTIRFPCDLQITVNVPDNLCSYMVPKLMLQPFIENSLIHGMDRDKGGRIEIEAGESGPDIWFRLTDNGKGMDVRQLSERKDLGVSGIRNVRERIKLYFGDPYGVEIESGINRGTVVHIRIPKVSPDGPGHKGEPTW
ncbi:sensor histidine kinase [Paenibacillus thermoaerophilus]|uniref:Sensor histidine kinase n=1 Tax=Paenibacillus thermoaerophilus TaxID=1215385 RepID=A0ABW2V5K0_9BACL|nr:sensor histidine kinase [Paenibacillus thermoaerophilus]